MAETLRIATGLAVGDCADLHVALELHMPTAQDRGIALCCLPGGGMTRQFYDLPVPDDRSFSFTEALCAQGYTCICLLYTSPSPRDS